MSGYVMLANAHAGSVEHEALDAAVGVLAAAGPTEVRMSSDPAALDAALTGLDGRVLVVAGGDGSLHLVANRLRRLGRLDQVGVGLVPLGTGNDFARAAGIPLDAHAAAIALTTARPHRFDLLEDDTGRVVVNAAHAGLGAEAAAVAADHKPRLGPLAYPLGALLAGLREEGWALRVSVDGTAIASGERLLMVGWPTVRRLGAAPRCARWPGPTTAGWTWWWSLLSDRLPGRASRRPCVPAPTWTVTTSTTYEAPACRSAASRCGTTSTVSWRPK
jgi:diacylglycerol kinase family enzyme